MIKNSHTDTSFPDEFLENYSNTNQVFLSFAAKISKVNFNVLLNHFAKAASDVYYFSQPDKNIQFLSFDDLTIQTFKSNEFNKITNEIKVLKSKLISNHEEFPETEFPVFLTCAKFPVNKSSNEWSKFGEIDFLIPKLSLFQSGNNFFLLYNILTESFSSPENLNETLERYAEQIYQLESKLEKVESEKAVINLIEESDDENKWNDKVSQIINEIKSKKVEKVVLAKRIKYDVKSEIDWQLIFNELNKNYPNCTNYLLKSGKSIFFGSTPELLAKFSGEDFYTEALAGSISRGKDQDQDKEFENKLLQSKKNNFEHNAVTQHIKSSVQKFIKEIEISGKPVVKKFSNIQHLQTIIKGKLEAESNIFDIILSLFPTPAVCGISKDKALKFIDEFEEFDRGLFAGLIGWFNCEVYGEFYVTIRCGLVNQNNLYAYAGCGIVEDSDPQEEYEETKLKLKPILSLFKNANKS
jgi:menaquinone-specific isochorismate synthase